MLDFDANATTTPDARVREAMWPYFGEACGNASSPHRVGRRALQAWQGAVEQVAALIGAHSEELIFTSGATESIHSVFDFVRREWPRRRLLIGATEHAASFAAAQRWSDSGGEVAVLPVNEQGLLDLQALNEALKAAPEGALLSLIAANNETGVLSPVAQAAAMARGCGALVHLDAAQWVGKVPLNVSCWPIDYLSFSAHKFHGPQGIGALWVGPQSRFRAWLGGGEQQAQRRAGTLPVALAVGFGAAAELAAAWLRGEGPQRLAQCRDALEADLKAALPGLRVHGAGAARLPNTSCLALPGVPAADLRLVLDQRGLLCSAGSACHSASLHPSAVLQAMGVDAETAASSLRFSLSRFHEAPEVRRGAQLIAQAAAHVQRQRHA